MLEDSFDLPGLQLLNLILILLSIAEFNKSTAMKSVDVVLIVLPIQMEEILDLPMEVLELVK